MRVACRERKSAGSEIVTRGLPLFRFIHSGARAHRTEERAICVYDAFEDCFVARGLMSAVWVYMYIAPAEWSGRRC